MPGKNFEKSEYEGEPRKWLTYKEEYGMNSSQIRRIWGISGQ